MELGERTLPSHEAMRVFPRHGKLNFPGRFGLFLLKSCAASGTVGRFRTPWA
jgi:hypothetical protein